MNKWVKYSLIGMASVAAYYIYDSNKKKSKKSKKEYASIETPREYYDITEHKETANGDNKESGSEEGSGEA